MRFPIVPKEFGSMVNDVPRSGKRFSRSDQARRTNAQFIEAHCQRRAFEFGAGDHSDGTILHEENERVGTGALVNPRLVARANIKDGWPRFGKPQVELVPFAPPGTSSGFFKH
jgi:hypothetical protein